MATGMEDIRAAAVTAGRDPDRLLWHAMAEARWENGAPKDPGKIMDTLRGYRDIGCHNVTINPKARTAQELFSLLEWIASEVLPHFAD